MEKLKKEDEIVDAPTFDKITFEERKKSLDGFWAFKNFIDSLINERLSSVQKTTRYIYITRKEFNKLRYQNRGKLLKSLFKSRYFKKEIINAIEKLLEEKKR